MNYYLLLYELVDGYLERREAHRTEHLARAAAARERGALVLAGAYGDPPIGAALVFRGATEDEARSFAVTDPYVLNGLITHWQVFPWKVVIGDV